MRIHSWLLVGGMLLGGCQSAFHGAIINGTAIKLDAVEFVYPDGKRLTFHDMEPYRMKAFEGSAPKGDIRLFWKEGAEGSGKTYGLKLHPEEVQQLVPGSEQVLVLRIENEHGASVLVGSVPAKDFRGSLLQRHGTAHPAQLIEH